MEKVIPLKTRLEVGYIRRASALVENTLREIRKMIAPGMTTLAINRYCEEQITDGDAGKALKGYRGYPAGICASVNHVAAHGLPTDTPLTDGDMVTIDITVELAGWYGDGSWTYLVGRGTPDQRRLLKAAWLASMAGIKAARAGNRMGDVGHAISSMALKYGCRVMDNFVGHGIGRDIHEEPMVFPVGEKGVGQPIVPGMVFTIEPILTLGCGKTKTLEDGWSIVTTDGSPCAQFEHTVAVFSQKTEVLTLQKASSGGILPLPPY